MRTKKPRVHREHLRPVKRGGRKSCSSCKVKMEQGEWIWSFGYYRNAKFCNLQDVCKACWPVLAAKLLEHEAGCSEKCTIVLVTRGSPQPAWMTLTGSA